MGVDEFSHIGAHPFNAAEEEVSGTRMLQIDLPHRFVLLHFNMQQLEKPTC